ncbi:DNA-binding response regulator, AraC family [Fulvivirga imtechensis AK7]|uniref:histidine kinase n=1 Tax=Fulvivirga imtechensis AK7 TaxID=1237149 RepID=L8JQ45_9BACT|nr:substrate-binding domain-containing protein [Fulvivirga imtechensis]ELR71081.1 DNA-binding response regulator, AraC family [Fulvivirga imtechensis AK7]
MMARIVCCKVWPALALISLSILCYSCKSGNEEIVIGFSQCTGNDLWRKAMHDDMYRELSFYDNARLIIKDAEDNNTKQIQHIKEFIQADVDILIVSPNEAGPVTPYIEQAYNAGIPLIITDRKSNSNLYTAYIGADNFEIGKAAAEYALQSFVQDSVKILEIWGLSGSTPAIDRHRGFIEGLAGNDAFEIVATINGEWQYEKAHASLGTAIDTLDIDLIFAHNDQMGKAAHEILLEKKRRKEVSIYGVDGLPGSGGGLEMVTEGVLDATFLYPTGGDDAIRLAMDILKGRPVAKDHRLLTTAIHSDNVRTLKLQADKILSQQQSIMRQQKLIAEQHSLYKSQRIILYMVSGGLVLILVLAIILIKLLHSKQQINKKLKQKNEQIEQASQQVRDANEAKLKFFTNISHEFRTPLTLILGPVEEMLRQKNRSLKEREELGMVYKNAQRLLRLINQLMDFRKIENNKLQVRASSNELMTFIEDIVSLFRKVANAQNIDLQFKHEASAIEVWFDKDMIDKVLFNLLSNAFKFVSEKGFVHITVSEGDTTVDIEIEDNGRGMSDEHVLHAFDRFYVGENNKGKGTGLGLALSKDLIELHHGSISVQSKQHVGTKFTVRLKKGNAHFKETELTHEEPAIINDDNHMGLGEFNTYMLSSAHASEAKENTILIVEDDEHLRQFLINSLSEYFSVITATTGTEGLKQVLEQVPDLVVTDLSLPELDGFGLVKRIKSDMRTSHIPVIMLTSTHQESSQLEGLRSGAELYITKPFRLSLLLEGIKTQLRNREILKSHYAEYHTNGRENSQADVDLNARFLRQFKALINNNLANTDFNVESISEELGMSRVQLYRKVKNMLGCSVHDYLNDARLSKAKSLLQGNGLTISEIAYESGFSSPAYFSTAFKAKFKLTPSEYKNSLSAN